MHGRSGKWDAKIFEWLHGSVVCNVASDLGVGRLEGICTSSSRG